tara:strand:- start:21 stop:851 length:831 start_codon:yes stop_codon:yes gene_type:complete
MNGDLYIVSTPIGNLEDITLRALNVLRDVDIIFAESVERTKTLLSHYQIDKKVLSYNKDNEKRKAKEIYKFLEDSNDIALVTDAGTPSISDPGFYLLSNLKTNIRVIPIPGASSLSCAMSLSRIPINSFIFSGFLPKKACERKKRLSQLSTLDMPICVFESKHRLISLLKDISTIFGNDTIVGIFRELTKVYETVLHDTVSNLIDIYEKNQPKGEFVLIISPKKISTSTKEDYLIIIKDLISKNFTNKDIVEIINIFSKTPKKEIYKNVLSIRHNM